MMATAPVNATNEKVRVVARTVAEHGDFTLKTDDLSRAALKHGINFGTFSAYYYALKKNPDLYREALNGHAPQEGAVPTAALVVDEGAKLMGRFLTAARRVKELEREIERLEKELEGRYAIEADLIRQRDEARQPKGDGVRLTLGEWVGVQELAGEMAAAIPMHTGDDVVRAALELVARRLGK